MKIGKENKMCQCPIKEVLDEDEVRFVKCLFDLINRKGPQGDKLAVIKNNLGVNCGCFYSWGDTYYCDNQAWIEKYIINKQQ